jgi:hypothetical protein
MFKPALVAALLAFSGLFVVAQEQRPRQAIPPDAQVEQFLLHAKILHTHGVGKGITGSLRASLSDGTTTHDAQIQQIDEYRSQFAGPAGTELNFRDSWSFNVAAYKLDRMLGLNLVPVSVGRLYRGHTAAFTWWIDDVLMDEGERLKKKLSPPDTERWNQQMSLVRVFDQLIGNTDRNLGNLLITSDWRIWAIDHTRAFRLVGSVRTPENVTRCDREVLERMKALDRATLQRTIGSFMYTNEIPTVLSRRDEIVRIFEKAGPSALFDR